MRSAKSAAARPSPQTWGRSCWTTPNDPSGETTRRNAAQRGRPPRVARLHRQCSGAADRREAQRDDERHEDFVRFSARHIRQRGEHDVCTGSCPCVVQALHGARVVRVVAEPFDVERGQQAVMEKLHRGKDVVRHVVVGVGDPPKAEVEHRPADEQEAADADGEHRRCGDRQSWAPPRDHRDGAGQEDEGDRQRAGCHGHPCVAEDEQRQQQRRCTEWGRSEDDPERAGVCADRSQDAETDQREDQEGRKREQKRNHERAKADSPGVRESGVEVRPGARAVSTLPGCASAPPPEHEATSRSGRSRRGRAEPAARRRIGGERGSACDAGNRASVARPSRRSRDHGHGHACADGCTRPIRARGTPSSSGHRARGRLRGSEEASPSSRRRRGSEGADPSRARTRNSGRHGRRPPPRRCRRQNSVSWGT